MPSKHKAGGCSCCGCSCTFELVDCDYSWDCPDAVRTVFYGECESDWIEISDTGSSGTATIKKDREYKLDVYCDDSVTITRTYNLGVLSTDVDCDSDCVPNPIDNCECALTDTTKRSIATCDVTVGGTVATCTDCGGSASSHNWDGTYTVDCNDSIDLFKATLVKAACGSRSGDDVYVIEGLRISFDSDGTSITVVFTLEARLATVGAGAPNPCPTVTTSCSAYASALRLNQCEWIGTDTSLITWKNCINYDDCGNDSTSSKKECVTSLYGTMTCIPLPPFFVNLCAYSGISVSVSI